MLVNWTEQNTDDFLTTPFTFAHQLAQTGAFTEETIARLLEIHPDTQTDINLYDISETGEAKVRTGTRGSLSGDQILDAIKRGRLWVNIRRASLSDPKIAQAVADLFADFSAHVKGFKPFHILDNLLISGPSARVPFHADTPAVALLHLIGKKRIWIYPNSGKWLTDAAMEKVALKETTEDLPFSPAWDEDAMVFDLAPGMGINWPYNAPHRVDNLGTFNASLSCEFMTWGGRLRHGAYYTNGILRRSLGINPPNVPNMGPWGRTWRFATSVLLKKLKVSAAKERKIRVEFSLSDLA